MSTKVGDIITMGFMGDHRFRVTSIEDGNVLVEAVDEGKERHSRKLAEQLKNELHRREPLNRHERRAAARAKIRLAPR